MSGRQASGWRTVYRPVRARAVVYGCAVAVMVAMIVLAIVLPSTGPHPWGPGSRLAMVVFGAAVVFLLHRLADVRVEAAEAGVLVVNVVGRRRLEWAEIVGVRLLRDDAWMMLDLADGESLAAMGVQKSEGKRGERQAAEFARLVADNTRVPGHE